MSKKCLFQGCNKIPKFNHPTEKKGIYCSEHKEENMIKILAVLENINKDYNPICSNDEVLMDLITEFDLMKTGENHYAIWKNPPKNYEGNWINASVLYSVDMFYGKQIDNLVLIFNYLKLEDSHKLDMIIHWLKYKLNIN